MLPSEVLIQVLLLESFDGMLLIAHHRNLLLMVASHQLLIELILNKPLLRLRCTFGEE